MDSIENHNLKRIFKISIGVIKSQTNDVITVDGNSFAAYFEKQAKIFGALERF